MCIYTRHEIFLPKQWKIQLAFDNCFDVNVGELDVNKKRLRHALKFRIFFLKWIKMWIKSNKNQIKMWGICCLDDHKLKAFLKR